MSHVNLTLSQFFIFRKVVLLTYFSFVASAIFAQSSLQKATQKLVQHTSMKPASISLTVMDVKTGKILSSHQPNLSVSPASSLKVVTTASALAILGKDYRFKTEIQYDGEIKNGVLNGNLYLKGYGDPTLGANKPKNTTSYSQLMEQFATAIQKIGIQEIKGKIVGDATFFDSASTPPTWQWEDMGNYYGAGIYGLNINANHYKVQLRQTSKLGQQPKVIGTQPQLYNTWLVNELTSATSGSGDNCYIFAAPRQNTRILRGTIPVGKGTFKVKGSLPDPPFTAASLLLTALEKRGIKTSKSVTTVFLSQLQGEIFTSTRKTIHTHYSPSLYNIVKVTNEESINLYCEAMLKVIGNKQKGKATRDTGIEAIQEFWKERGVDMAGFFMEDGCGLSARNGITSKQLSAILRKVEIDRNLDFDFTKALSIAGETGTLRWLFKKSAAKGRIFGKTGSMNRIRSYTGYVKTISGRWLTFSVIVNNYTGTNTQARTLLKKWMLALVSS